jgi:hypothetical protein
LRVGTKNRRLVLVGLLTPVRCSALPRAARTAAGTIVALVGIDHTDARKDRRGVAGLHGRRSAGFFENLCGKPRPCIYRHLPGSREI